MSRKRHRKGTRLKLGPNGLYRCRFCGREVMPPRRTFCDDKCVHEHMIRTNGQYARRCVEARDRGKCASCGRNVLELLAELRARVMAAFGRTYSPIDKRPTKMAHRFMARHGFKPPKPEWSWVDGGRWWQADHIRPVAEGGGECGLDNLATLCTPCHQQKSAQQAGRAAERRRARKGFLARAQSSSEKPKRSSKKKRRRKAKARKV